MTAQAAYDHWHAQHVVDEAADSPWHRMVQARIDPDRDLAGKRVLEIGCGRGGFACWLARHPACPAEVVAADFSPTAVAMGRAFAAARGIPGVTWTIADIEALTPFGTEFDTVFSFETIEHVPHPARAVRELARVLKPGGRLFLTTPNYLSTIGLYRLYCWIRGKPFDECGQPICQLTMIPRTRTWVRKAGLGIAATDTTGQYLPVPGRPPLRLDWLEHPHGLMRWFGLHSVVVAEKPETVVA
jgi:2-polyprenyl-3-methyl-5-hydroxy-6-metoxy-1,4-benzoquinol methylase